MALAHVVENKVEAAYRRGDLFERRKKMMQDWANFVCLRLRRRLCRSADEWQIRRCEVTIGAARLIPEILSASRNAAPTLSTCG